MEIDSGGEVQQLAFIVNILFPSLGLQPRRGCILQPGVAVLSAVALAEAEGYPGQDRDLYGIRAAIEEKYLETDNLRRSLRKLG